MFRQSCVAAFVIRAFYCSILYQLLRLTNYAVYTSAASQRLEGAILIKTLIQIAISVVRNHGSFEESSDKNRIGLIVINSRPE